MSDEVLLASIAASLERIATALSKEAKTLGFGDAPRPVYIYCNRSQGGLWYRLEGEGDKREPVSIPHNSLTGFIVGLEFKQVERRGKESWKTHLHVKADRHYILESGYDSIFSKSIISSLAVLSHEQLQQPATIEVRAADSDEVLFPSLYVDGERVFAPYDEKTNWKTVAQRAVAAVNGVKEEAA